tara:strand:- start:8176 stop:8505 length:330 start_codon:yes stop_codon:yes gene_type:complete
MLSYIIRFFIGGTIITLIHYFGESNNTKVLSLLPFIPVYFIFAYFYVCKNEKKNINNFLFNLLIFLSIYALFVITVLFVYNSFDNYIIAPIIGYLVWFVLVFSIKNYLF